MYCCCCCAAGVPLLPALSSTLWAVGCQLRMPTRLECPSSFTTGWVRDEVSPPSGISQICAAENTLRPKAEGRNKAGGAPGLQRWWSSWAGASYHDAAVLGAAGDDVVVVGTELDVQDRPRVAAHGRVTHVDASRLRGGEGRGGEGTSEVRTRRTLNEQQKFSGWQSLRISSVPRQSAASVLK